MSLYKGGVADGSINNSHAIGGLRRARVEASRWALMICKVNLAVGGKYDRTSLSVTNRTRNGDRISSDINLSTIVEVGNELCQHA